MADTKTSDETSATALDGTELVRLVQSSASKKTTAAVMGHQFRGARVRLNADDTAQNVTTQAAVSFDQADRDTDSFWSAGSPTRLTIPASKGITEVMLTGQVNLTSTTADTFATVVIIHRNSSNTALCTYGPRFVEMGSTAKVLQAATGMVLVDDGDYFTLEVREETDTSVTIEGDDVVQTFLSLIVVGMEPV